MLRSRPGREHMQMNFRQFFIILTTAIFYCGSAHAARILVVIPGSSAFNLRTSTVVDELEKKGHQVTITVPPGIGPNVREWQKSGIKFAIDPQISKGSDAAHYEPWKDIDPFRFEALALIGGPARMRPTKTDQQKDQALKLYLDSAELRGMAQHFNGHGKPIAALSHGVEVLAYTPKLNSDQSLLYGRTVTGPNEILDRRNLLTRFKIIDGTSETETQIKDVLRDPVTDFIPGPSRIEDLSENIVRFNLPDIFDRGFSITDRGLITARSGRDAKELAKRLDQILLDPFLMRIRSFYIQYNAKGQEIWSNVIEARPDGETRADIVFTHGFYDHPLNYLPLMKHLTAGGYRVIAYTLPHHGDNYGIGDAVRMTSYKDISKLAAAIEYQTLQDQSRPLFEMGYSIGGQIIARKYQLNSGFVRPTRTPAGLILLSPAFDVYPMVGKFGFATKDTLADDPQFITQPLKPTTPLWPRVWDITSSIMINLKPSQKTLVDPRIPIYVSSAGKDLYVKSEATLRWIETQKSLGHTQISNHHFENSKHQVLANPLYREALQSDVTSFCDKALKNLGKL